MKTFAANINILRKSKGLTQAEIATAIGFKRNTWNNYENDASEPSIEGLLLIAQYFGITIDDLLTKDFSQDAPLINNEEDNGNTLKSTPNQTPISTPKALNLQFSDDYTFKLSKPDDKDEAVIWHILQQVRRLEKEVRGLQDKINNNGHSGL